MAEEHSGGGTGTRSGTKMGRRWPWILGIIVVLLAVVVAVWDWNWFKGPIERQVSAATGREFRIEGDLRVDLGRTINVGADGIRLANAPWSDEPDMARIAKLDVGINFWPLFRGQVELPYVRIEQPSIVAERNAKGEANWEFGARDEPKQSGDTPMALPKIGELTILDGRVRYREPETEVDVTVASQVEEKRQGEEKVQGEEKRQVDEKRQGDEKRADAGTAQRDPVHAGAAASAPLDIKGGGRYRGQRFMLDARVDSPLDIQRTDRPYRMRVDARAGATKAAASGEILHPLQLEDFSMRMAMSGPNLAELTKLAGVALPETPPYSVDGHLGRRGSVFSYENFKGKLGDSDIGGNVSYEPRPTRPMLRADLKSSRLDLDDLAGLLGVPPSGKKGETASAKQRAAAEKQAERARVLPDKPYDLEKLRSIDADIRFRATRINAPSLPISAIDTHLRLDAGRLRLDPLEAGVAGGRAQGNIGLDASGNPIKATTRLQLRNLELPKLAPGAQSLADSAGKLAGTIDFTGRGNSVAAMLASANGNV
ncbi:MAG: AsmA family protein, partial [Burkholderiaceae bacterium]